MRFLKTILGALLLTLFAATQAWATDTCINRTGIPTCYKDLGNGVWAEKTAPVSSDGSMQPGGTVGDPGYIIVNSSALPTGAATAANQTTANASLSTIVTNTTVGAAGTPASQVTTVQGITSGTPLIVAGAVASGATDSGNPVKVGCVYNSTQPSFTTGQRADLQCGSKGSLRIELFGANGVSGISALTAQADATSTAQSSINTTAFRYIYNGSSWDRVKKPNTVGRLVSAANTTNGTSVKASAADVFSITATNTTASLVYLKLYNKASAPTVGTDTPFVTYALPPSNAFFQVEFSSPLYMGTGLAYAITAAAADNDTTAIASGAVVGLGIAYQ